MSDFNFGDNVEERIEQIGEWAADMSGIQRIALTQAYLIKSPKGASALRFKTIDKEQNERSYTIYFTNRKGETFYTDKNKGNKVMLPGFQLLNNLCRFTVGKTFQEVIQTSSKKKVISVYDPESRAEIDKEETVFPSLYNKPVIAGVIRIRKNKWKKRKKTAEETFSNEIKIFFDGKTGASAKELAKKVAEADLKDKDKWVKAWPADRFQDDYEEVAGSDEDAGGEDAFSVDPFADKSGGIDESSSDDASSDDDNLFSNMGDDE